MVRLTSEDNANILDVWLAPFKSSHKETLLAGMKEPARTIALALCGQQESSDPEIVEVVEAIRSWRAECERISRKLGKTE